MITEYKGTIRALKAGTHLISYYVEDSEGNRIDLPPEIRYKLGRRLETNELKDGDSYEFTVEA